MNTIEALRLRGLLSFGWDETVLPLRPLNLLIGPNGSGKSNVIDALVLLRAAPRDLHALLRQRGGAAEWLHHGEGGDGVASLEIEIGGFPGTDPRLRAPLRYRLALRIEEAQATVVSEDLQTRDPHPADQPFLFLSVAEGEGAIKSFDPSGTEQDNRFGAYRWRTLDTWNPRQPVLAQLRDPLQYPQLTALSDLCEQLRIYQSWHFGPHTPARLPQPADQPNHALLPDASNLGLVLNRLRKHGATRQALRDHLRSFYEPTEDIDISVEGGTVQLFLLERGLTLPTPAHRLSDGTLRWLALLALLLDPRPPPLLCIEEPELGLHPDLLPTLAGLLKEAATRTQLIVTTHSDALVSEFSDTPEDVVVCERDGSATTLRRLEREPLQHWLERYSLGHVWRTGELGGNRW